MLAAIDPAELTVKRGVITVMNRAQRRDAIAKKAGCSRCHVRLKKGDDLVWDDGRSTHRACAVARNEAIGQAEQEMLQQRLKDLGFVVPDLRTSLLVPAELNEQ